MTNLKPGWYMATPVLEVNSDFIVVDWVGGTPLKIQPEPGVEVKIGDWLYVSRYFDGSRPTWRKIHPDELHRYVDLVDIPTNKDPT